MAAKPSAGDPGELRRRAEKKLGPGSRPGREQAAVSLGQTKKLLHELQVHQVELEMQNEELLAARAGLEEALARYTTLYDFAPVGYCTLNRDGRLLELNLTAARFLGRPRSELIGGSLAGHLDGVCVRGHEAALARVFAEGGPAVWDLRLKEKGGTVRDLRAEGLVAESGKTCFTALIDVSAAVAAQAARDAALARQTTMSQRLVAVQEEERRRLSMELHDHTSGNLAALDLLLRTLAGQLSRAAIPSADSVATIGNAQQLLRETAAEIRSVCGELRPPMLDYAGPLPALESYAQSFRQRYGIPVAVEAKGQVARLPVEIESALFRIAQEALTNCAKHAGASAASVLLDYAGDHVAMEVADNGAGFVPGSVGKGRLGLRIMRERAEFSGGRLSVVSKPGKGTKIRAEF